MKRSKLRPVSKAPKRRLEMECDKLWQEVIHKLFKGRCLICGFRSLTTGHHLIKRRVKWLRHCVMNGVLLCDRCHRQAEEFQENFVAALRQVSPKHYEWMEEHRYSEPQTVTTSDLKETRKVLKQVLEQLA